MNWHRVIRVALLLVFAAGVTLLVHRLKRTPEQQDLTHYVEVEIPALEREFDPIGERLRRLNDKSLKPDEARQLLVDDVIPRLIKLKKDAAQARTDTSETKLLNADYLRAVDRSLEACRTSVRVIDDPKLRTLESAKQVFAAFDDASRAFDEWHEHVRQACVRHRLAPPSGTQRAG